MAVKFKRDYRGKLTGEQFFVLDSVADFDAGTEAELIGRGVAEKVAPPESVVEKPSTAAKSPRRRSKKKNE